ncbi:STM4014 family protein [Herpetosiphon llansteffanensis]|uniref:STM4014 family protein n=1 Tax=Herpetosiphon llansteffanensis TaxID=2094568 RepID=UPI000D7CBCFB|nr:STM4014 family protein [Herpetosiphon llansteffanensis]
MIVIGNPRDRRVAFWQAALARQGQPPARVISYYDLLANRLDLASLITLNELVRIESPGKDEQLYRELVRFAAELTPEPAFEHWPLEADLPQEHGRLWGSRQWYRGYCHVLRQLEQQLTTLNAQLLQHPADIAVMFDKVACHARLAQADVLVPRSLPAIGSFEQLQMAMQAQRWQRVFIKLAHGSSASGVVAYRTNGRQMQAITTVELLQTSAGLQLYNSRNIRTYTHLHEIQPLIDALAQQRIHVEEWVPKARLAGKVYDLRMLVIAGKAQHTVVRTSSSPITNLHLLNPRGDLAAVQAQLGAEFWQTVQQQAQAAAACFDRSLYAGVDLLIANSLKHCLIGEVNAFGDLLPNVLVDGYDSYEAEIVGAGGCGSGIGSKNIEHRI